MFARFFLLLFLFLLRGFIDVIFKDFGEDTSDLLFKQDLQLLLHFHVETIFNTEIGRETLCGISFIDHDSFHTLSAYVHINIELWLASVYRLLYFLLSDLLLFLTLCIDLNTLRILAWCVLRHRLHRLFPVHLDLDPSLSNRWLWCLLNHLYLLRIMQWQPIFSSLHSIHFLRRHFHLLFSNSLKL